MSSPDSPRDTVNYTSIRFPSDRITLADIRRAHPERFDVDSPPAFRRLGEEESFRLNMAIDTERLLARAAFEKATGNGPDYLGQVMGLDRDNLIEELTEDYRLYGVAVGRQVTEQLVRDLEAQAASQAGRKR